MFNVPWPEVVGRRKKSFLAQNQEERVLGLKRNDRGPRAALQEAGRAWGKWFGDAPKATGKHRT